MLKDTIVLVVISAFLLICWLMNLLLDKIINNETMNLKIIGREFIKFITIIIYFYNIIFFILTYFK